MASPRAFAENRDRCQPRDGALPIVANCRSAGRGTGVQPTELADASGGTWSSGAAPGQVKVVSCRTGRAAPSAAPWPIMHLD